MDVREEAEFAFGHIEGAKSIPMGDLDARLNELDKDQQVNMGRITPENVEKKIRKLVRIDVAFGNEILGGRALYLL